MEWPVTKELNELLRFWKTDGEFKDGLTNDPEVTYATRTINIISKIDRLTELLNALHEVIRFGVQCYKIQHLKDFHKLATT